MKAVNRVAIAMLLALGPIPAVRAGETPAAPADVRKAVERSLSYLEQGGVAWMAKRGPANRTLPDQVAGTFDSNGVKIHYTDEGRGEPVLLIHGFAADIITNWGLPGIRKGLAREYRVIAMDNRGHGKSGKPHDPAKYGLEMVEDAVRLLDHLKIKKAHVIGYSMGGIITLKLAATHPERLRTVTLGGAGWMREADLSADKIAAALEQGHDLGRFISEATAPGQPKPSEQQVKLLSMLLASYNDNKALAACARGWKKLVVTEEDLKAIRVPVLAAVGSNDFLKGKVDDLQGRLPVLKTVVIDRTDHFTTFFSPRFLETLKSFLKQHRQPDDVK